MSKVRAPHARSAKGTKETTPELEPFPPLSTSLDTLLISNTDHQFRNLVYSILDISQLFTEARAHFASSAGVTSFQYGMMLAIAESGSIAIGALATKQRVSSPFVTAEIGKLESKGIIQRRPKQNDRRGTLIELTPFGVELIQKVGPMRRSTNDIIFSSLTRAQIGQLTKIILTLRANSVRALKELEDMQKTALP